ncbi:thiol:disulfide interchange protein DsbA/DsbL [Alcaligenaceae bacterium CGII-47]|nr:thiol:disulfide interchange protein DsbA/DsbL [Alcaligenaceae bacterium CGII-47]
MKNLLSRTLSGIALSSAMLLTPPVWAADSYITINPAQPSDTPEKIEVLEFFAYTCPHCAAIEPMVEKWAKTLPDNVVVRGVPVAFNASMVDLQKLYFTLDALGRLDLHPVVFKAIHDEHERLFKADAIMDWVAKQGVDRQTFQDAFNSFGINAKVMHANELAKTYRIEGTPSLAVGGKYVTSPSMTGTYEGAIEEADKLLKQILSQAK